MPRTGVVRHPLFIEHHMGAGHPESPFRLISIFDMLDQEDMDGRFEAIAPRPATREEITAIHHPSYYERIEATKGKFIFLDPDTSTCPESFDAARMAAGGTIRAVDAVMDRQVDNAFCLHRPPGHHAESNRAMGFCLFNNIAIGAAHALMRPDCRRVLIYDFDIHHGNGTQHSFFTRSDVLYVSTHQYPYYPGTGGYREVGMERGEGFTVNIPLDYGFGDGDYTRILDEVIGPIGRQYKPDLVMVSAGYDIYEEDPLGAMRVSVKGFALIMSRMLALADEVCGGKLVAVLEGGYHIQGLTNGVKACLNAMSAAPAERPAGSPGPERPESLDNVIRQVAGIQRPYWKNLQAD